MKKSKKAARPIRRAGRNPVIAVRVPAPLHQRIVESAKTSGRSMSEEMAALLERGFEWQDAFGDRMKMLDAAKIEIDRMVTEILKPRCAGAVGRRCTARRTGFRQEHAPQSGFVDPEAAPPSGFVDVEEFEHA